MSPTPAEAHQQFLSEIDNDIAEKKAELIELEAIRHWHAQKLADSNGSAGQDVDVFQGLCKWFELETSEEDAEE